MLRIHLIVPRYHTNLEPFVEEFLKLGHQVFIYTFKTSLAEIRVPKGNLKIVDLRAKECGQNVFRLMSLAANHLKDNIDVSFKNICFVRCEISRIGAAMLYALMKLGMQNRAVAFTQYPYLDMKLRHTFWQFLIERICRINYFTQVIKSFDNTDKGFACLSDYTESLNNHLDQNQAYIPLALPTVTGRVFKTNELVEIREHFKSFVTVAKCQPRKGLEEIILTFQEISQQLECKWRLRIVLQVLNKKQESYLKYLKDRYSLNSSNGIEMFTNLTTNETRSVISNSDIFVLNSTREPASFSHLEALALEVPIIINRNNGSSSVLPNQFGVKKISNIHELREAMIECSRDVSVLKVNVRGLHAELRKIVGARQLARKWISIANKADGY